MLVPLLVHVFVAKCAHFRVSNNEIHCKTALHSLAKKQNSFKCIFLDNNTGNACTARGSQHHSVPNYNNSAMYSSSRINLYNYMDLYNSKQAYIEKRTNYANMHSNAVINTS